MSIKKICLYGHAQGRGWIEMARTKRKVNPLNPAPAPVVSTRRVYRTGGYARLSLEDSGRPGADAIEIQRNLIENYITNQPDLQLYRLYCDNGQTGTDFDRPAFEQMMNDVQAGKIDCIVVKDLSRFGRNYLETGNYLERIFPLLDVRFIAINDYFDSLTAERFSDGYIIPLKNMINAAYSKDISRKVSSAFSMKRQNGEFIGSWAPYGYQKCADDHHRLEPNTETAPVVCDIFRWRAEGESYMQITRRLNGAGIPSPYRYLYLKGERRDQRCKNAVWTQTAVKRLLLNEVYLGHLVQGRNRSSLCEGKTKKEVPKEEWIIVRNTHDPLIDEEIFFTVQEMAEKTKQAQHDRLGKYDDLEKSPNIFQGLIYCADCKHSMERHRSIRGGGEYQRDSYMCPTHAVYAAACPNKYVQETQLKEILWDTLQREIALAGNIERSMKEREKTAQAAKEVANQEINLAKQSLDRAKMIYDSLYQNYADRRITEQEYTVMKKKYRNNIEQIKGRLAELEAKKQSEPNPTAKKPWITACGKFQAETGLTEEMIHTLVERVEIGAGDRVTITLRYQDERSALISRLKAKGSVVSI